MAHDLAVKSLKYNFLPEDIFKVQNEEILETKIFDTKIKNPIGLAAGLIKAERYIILYLDLDLDLLRLGRLLQKSSMEIQNQEFLDLKTIELLLIG